MELKLPPALAGERLDKIVGRLTGASRADTRRLFAGGRVKLLSPAGRCRTARKGEPARPGDTLVLDEPPEPLADAAVPDHDIPLRILLETPLLVVVNKPAGQPTAPIRAGERGTLANGLVARYPEMAPVGYGPREPGLCHRLDNDTSGAVLAARSEAAFCHLTGLLKGGALDKRYLLICDESGLADEGTIDLPIAPHPRSARRVITGDPHSRQRSLRWAPARTSFVVLERIGGRALVEARAPRARRHQIRAHFSGIGHPLTGDVLYGSPPESGLRRHALHGSRIAFSGDGLVRAFEVEVPLPQDLRGLIADASMG